MTTHPFPDHPAECHRARQTGSTGGSGSTPTAIGIAQVRAPARPVPPPDPTPDPALCPALADPDPDPDPGHGHGVRRPHTVLRPRSSPPLSRGRASKRREVVIRYGMAHDAAHRVTMWPKANWQGMTPSDLEPPSRCDRSEPRAVPLTVALPFRRAIQSRLRTNASLVIGGAVA